MELKEIKKNWREYTLVALGILVALAPWVALENLFGIANIILGGAIAIIGAWPFIEKFRKTQA